MEIRRAYEQLSELAQKLYGKREGQSIARIIFEDVFNIRNTRRRNALSKEEMQQLAGIKERLVQKEPVQYIVGKAHFYGMLLSVDSRVLIPRSETEELVYWILKDFQKESSLHALDIGTGSGCIALALKKARPDWRINALDFSPGALDAARANAREMELDIQFLQLDFLEEQLWGDLPAFDLIVSNPPYIPHREEHLMPAQVLEYEPALALFVSDEQPLIFYEKIARFGLEKLNPEGVVYVEMNEFNALQVKALFQQAGYNEVILKEDMYGKQRMLSAIKRYSTYR